ncbi:NAD-dependent succinate-semialdehyde dehydrogenase [Hufsiella ginkgonis]|uniref:Aldehyde dehydrogenase family protein n=1 Tax=Hufsiella ginkgonis TaxID=2695274 RepID=A0A7K1XYG5_9SPHI|nr:NAD-dependent succinate-semialdehyde dehydrogenase [Hufsiella ginkgonis]MXV15992.1 aldehyde dehydrogenase family protein [Hufsiella ginkgonis]
MAIQSVNPATGKVIRTYRAHTPEQVTRKISQAHKAWLSWKQTTFNERAALLRNISSVLHRRKAELANLMALEMGKPIKQGIAEIEKCATVCDYYAKNGATFLADGPVKTEAAKSYVSFQPLGVVLAVMPWNFPFWQVFRFLAPALMAGNCGVLKHASNVPGCALVIEEMLADAGFPEHVFKTLLVSGKEAGAVIENPLVKAVTLTGSTSAGTEVATKAASLLKKTVLELGGSDPYIVLEDADLELASRVCADSRLINSGQSCIAAKRFIVVKQVEKAFTRLFVEKMSAKKLGDPREEDTDIGPQARTDLRDQLHRQVGDSIGKGARLVLGGKIPKGKGAYYPVTVLTQVKKGAPAYDDELFGPVAAIISAKNEADAIRIANDTPFGLGAAVFTNDLQKGERIARLELNAGSCFVNTQVMSDPRLPFGGINASGYGRELGLYGIHEFVNIKTVYVK